MSCLSFTFHNNVANNTFDLIHANIWGLLKTPTYAGHRFFLTLVDDSSRFTWIYPMRNKLDALTIVHRQCPGVTIY